MAKKPVITFLLSTGIVSAGIFALPALVLAQPADLTINPGTGLAPQPPAPTAAPAPAQGGDAAAAEAQGNAYYGDYLDQEDVVEEGSFDGQVPLTHEVQTGDTLWNLSAYYFQDAHAWPKVWGLNPQITNPHWIYPGNVIRLREGQDTPVAQSARLEQQQDQGQGAEVLVATPSHRLAQTTYLDLDELEDVGTIDGSVAEKMLLATGDSVYIKLAPKSEAKAGDIYAIYTGDRKISRGGKVVGSYLEIAGELQLTFVPENARARGVVTRSVRAVERGMRVGPLEIKKELPAETSNQAETKGLIVDLIGPDDLIGEEAVVIVDRGSDDGVAIGNRFLVVRSGDAYERNMSPSSNVGQGDSRFPPRAIGEIKIIDVGKRASVGTVTFSIHEFGVGDMVFMRKGQ